jgi:hypothetical protein
MAEEAFEHVIRLADGLSSEEKLRLVEHIVRNLREPARQEPRSLRGIWAGKFPEDFDVDAALAEIRHEWESEW